MLGAVASSDAATDPAAPDVQSVIDEPPVLEDGSHAPGTTPEWAKKFRPPWWRGDKAAFESSVAAQRQASETPGSMDGGGGP